ncbi:sulfatase [Wocania ichthyoenteri]|uniref:sulfatase family protein n=1 Tax=Wocania ichthyoenteri TaxID=1230531 RepID=UPI00068FFC21|nr:sulfatase-like hydrolase/transferase [Wocania ichthyoenteri]
MRQNRIISFLFLIGILISSCKQSDKKLKIEKDVISNQNQPNIVLIMTDQHQAEALSIAGNLNLSTPNLDKLAKTGVRFNNAYVTFPLCTPSRSSMFTGKMPHNLGVNSNEKDDKKMQSKDKQRGLGHVLKQAGYDCAYGGKWHAHEATMVEGNGFEKIADFGDIPLAEKAINYLKSRQDKTQPFFLVASFDNPHNICEWARNQPLPYGNIPSVPLNETPELPVNFKKSETFPEALQIEQNASVKVYPTKNYTEEDWRQYRYAYYRLVEKVDKEIGKIIDAIDSLGLRENTVVIFTSDHGDGNASHGWNQKTALFQESIRVPFIINYKNKNTSEEIINTTLISNGLDLYPTILDYAGISISDELLGKSIKRLIEDKKNYKNHDYIVVETKFEGKEAHGTLGRALISKRYKYVIYNWGKHREQLFDLENDPYEINNLINYEEYLQNINEFRLKLINWCKQTNDKKFLKNAKLPSNSTMQSNELFDIPY